MLLQAESRIIEMYHINAKEIKNRATQYAITRTDNDRMIFSSILCFEVFGKEKPKKEICSILEQHISDSYPFSERQYYSFNGTYEANMSINSCILFTICFGLNIYDALLLFRFHKHDLLFEFSSEEEQEVLSFLWELCCDEDYRNGNPHSRFRTAEKLLKTKSEYKYIAHFEEC